MLIDPVLPATEIRETYGISKGRAKRILDRLRASGVKSRKGRSVVDQAAAVVILQSYLDARRSRA